MLSEKNKKWWKAAGIRAIKTMAQAAIPIIPVGVALWGIDWIGLVGIVLSTGVLSLLTSLAGLPEVEE